MQPIRSPRARNDTLFDRAMLWGASNANQAFRLRLSKLCVEMVGRVLGTVMGG